MHVLAFRTVLVVALCVSTATSAHARDRWVLVDDCLSGAAPPSAVVGTYNVAGETISLRCGTPVTGGMLHIDSDHPIEPGAEFDFSHCAFNVFAHGAARGVGARPELQLVDRELPGKTAVGVYDTGRSEVVTLYTTGPVSNDWTACSMAP